MLETLYKNLALHILSHGSENKDSFFIMLLFPRRFSLLEET
jgi:hypothetical protein